MPRSPTTRLSGPPTPDPLPSGWISYEPGPDGRIATPVAGVALGSPPRIHEELSAGGRRLPYWEFGGHGPVTLIIAGIHGGEHTPTVLGFQFIQWLERQSNQPAAGRIVVAPLVDPDGFAAKRRTNDRGVDLNRNFAAGNWQDDPAHRHGERPLSEAESRFVLTLMERYRPAGIVSIHAPLACVNYDGPAREVAEAMSRVCGLPVRASVGYPTPGSLGSYAGVDLGIPIITFELASKQDLRPGFAACRDALLAAHDAFAGVTRPPSATN